MSRMLRVFFVLVSLVFIPSFLNAAPDGKIEGRVRDSQSGESLPSANVFIEGTRSGTATDLQGKFVLSQLQPGIYRLVARYIGYQEKTIEIVVSDGETAEVDIRLDFKAIEGEVVSITAQAEGQIAAINQQLSSNTISNIVSESRIRELPDVNAAESIGRLPGVSIERSGGEANKVSIRGLSPKYNTVTVNGVRVPATGGDDRSVDLSLISSNMLDGIEVKKAITPDMDADVLGGTVDLRLKEAQEKLTFNISVQRGYNQIQDYYDNYNYTANVSNRFLNDRLGIIASLNTDDYNRSADKFSGNYRQQQESGTNLTQIVARDISLREENVTRGRTGASLLLDYRLPNGKITANSFFNRLKWDGLYRINRMDVNDNRHYYDIEDRGGTTKLFTGGAALEQDFGWIRYDLGVARTASRANNPGERTWHFVQENNAFEGAVTTDTHPNLIPTIATNDSNTTGLQDIYVWDTNREENQTSVQLNLQLPFRFGSQINGYIKTGGKFRWLDRLNNEDQAGRNGLYYGNNNGPNPTLAALDALVPEWGIEATVDEYGVLPMWVFGDNYNRSDFLEGEYPLGFTTDLSMLQRLTDALRQTDEYLPLAIGSRGRDYDGVERYKAGYIMGEFNFGQHITLLPGIRWEGDYSEYNGQRYREVVLNNVQAEPTDLDSLTVIRENNFWLPMVHLQVNPSNWLKIRLARTETLTRPDFTQYAPITSINSYQSYIRAANSLLKPAESTNYDAAISVYQNHIGLLTVAGFHKSVDDLIFQTRLNLRADIQDQVGERLPGLNIPATWLQNAAPAADTYINNPFKATYKGVEIDWQTHFWYLPSIFRGVVLNVNYTYIQSETEKRLYFLGRGAKIRERPPLYETVVIDSSRTARMPDQPAHIANITVGYDFKGFSGRLSYLYQTDKVTFIDTEPVLDNFSGAYARWDLTLQQRIGYGIQLFANFTNLNARPDENFRGDALINPAYTEYYGFTMDVGARYSF